ncbi:MAG TPA: hypothetical protein VK638_30330, partial [Edaphobacter sp.]|nr:hypothetical protein [Edaphobacter sp.]
MYLGRQVAEENTSSGADEAGLAAEFFTDAGDPARVLLAASPVVPNHRGAEQVTTMRTLVPDGRT